MGYLIDRLEKVAAGITDEDLDTIRKSVLPRVSNYEKLVQDTIGPDRELTPVGRMLVQQELIPAGLTHGGVTLGTETPDAKSIQSNFLNRGFSEGHIASAMGGTTGGLAGAGLGALLAGKNNRSLGALVGGSIGATAGSAAIPALVRNERVAALVRQLSEALSGSAHGKIETSTNNNLKKLLA